jgi:tripartite-type tricarboxylate transporter receptor subunit TctC
MPAVRAQGAYPSKPLRVIVPQPPGGGFDFVARLLADRLSKVMGQSVVVENKPGSGTLVGTDAAAKAAPDGYTLLMGSVSNLVLNMGLYRNLSYDSLRDFEPVGLAVSYSYTLMARKDLPFASLKELVAYAKSNPGKLTYASAGNGSGQHVLAAALCTPPGGSGARAYRGMSLLVLGGRVDLLTSRPPRDPGGRRQCPRPGRIRAQPQPDAPRRAQHHRNRRGRAGA